MKHSRLVLRMLAMGALMSAILDAPAANQHSTNAASGEVLLTGSLGRLVRVPTDDVPPGLLPPADMGLNAQTPNPSRGTKIPEAVRRRTEENRVRQDTFEFFPAAQPRLMPYLAAQDEYRLGRVGALCRPAPRGALQRFSGWVECGGYRFRPCTGRWSAQRADPT